jgi:uncharacterized membrane protein YhiD involved in acid resistance
MESELTDIILRAAAAVVVGALVGFNRAGKPIGMRT